MVSHITHNKDVLIYLCRGGYVKRYLLFFYLVFLTLLILVVVLSGCGPGTENIEQNFSNQLVEATLPADTSGNMPHINSGTIPGYDIQSKTIPQSNDIRSNTNNIEKPSMDSERSQVNNYLSSTKKVAKNVYLGKENIGGMSEIELAAKLKKIADKTDVTVREAQYDSKTWTLRKERAGIKLNIDKIMNAAFSADSGKKIKYSYVNIKPHIKAAQIKADVKLIGKCTTPILDRSRSRVKNIRLAANKIDYKVIMPGEEFSFNNSTGSKTKKKGYENATVIVRTPIGPKHKKAPGGGVCQLSTTLYNAVQKSQLKVTERHPHSDEVHYVPEGKDATVSYNGVDFRFVNNRSKPIMLRFYIGRRTVTVKILENSGI